MRCAISVEILPSAAQLYEKVHVKWITENKGHSRSLELPQFDKTSPHVTACDLEKSVIFKEIVEITSHVYFQIHM